MAVCVFDNPASMARECWQDGKLVYHCQAHLFFIKPEYGGLRRKGDRHGTVIDWRANVGDWNLGQIVGDAAALHAKP